MTASLAEHEETYETWFQDVLPVLVRACGLLKFYVAHFLTVTGSP